MRKARLKGKPVMSNNVEKRNKGMKEEGCCGGGKQRDQNKTTAEKNVLKSSLVLKVSGLRTARPNIRSNLPARPPVSLHQRDVWVPAPLGGAPLAGVDLGPNHTHDLLLHFRLLGVDVGISDLAIFIHKEEAGTDVVGYWTYPDVTVLLQVL